MKVPIQGYLFLYMVNKVRNSGCIIAYKLQLSEQLTEFCLSLVGNSSICSYGSYEQ